MLGNLVAQQLQCDKGCVTMQDAYECLQTSFAFDANFSAALPASPQCGAFSATGNTSYCQQPVCQIYSVDMAFCGQEGLVTDQSQALLVMVCTQEVNVCLDCFTVIILGLAHLTSCISSFGTVQSAHCLPLLDVFLLQMQLAAGADCGCMHLRHSAKRVYQVFCLYLLAWFVVHALQ